MPTSEGAGGDVHNMMVTVTPRYRDREKGNVLIFSFISIYFILFYFVCGLNVKIQYSFGTMYVKMFYLDYYFAIFHFQQQFYLILP